MTTPFSWLYVSNTIYTYYASCLRRNYPAEHLIPLHRHPTVPTDVTLFP